MTNGTLKAAFCRGGTSKAVLFNGADLPEDRASRDRIFLHVLGSPDAYGRQLDGMGGGLSSLSKVVIVERSARTDADLDYTFVQIAVDKPVADYGAMCGNMASAVGPFAIDEGIIKAEDGLVKVRIHNTNTKKLFDARFEVANGKTVEVGDFSIPGISQLGARIQLDFLDPGGAATGKLLPTGNVIDRLIVGEEEIQASMVDASNPVVFIRAEDVGLTGTESPDALDVATSLMMRLDQIRRSAAVAMGMAQSPQDALLSNPKIALIAPPHTFDALDGHHYASSEGHLSVRLVSMGNVHRAITLTGAMCVAVAARIPGTLVHSIVKADVSENILVANPSGILPVKARVETDGRGLKALSTTTFRTQRRIMSGLVHYPTSLLERSK
ncbi:PrpF domain-containing protein [uncultured Cohaesibacter sp.]|uniref:2-methylaconitate cis-trans isomerase PrpF family protein n=1 Tax=uncultured Cohaesibacter sp. TaxID=1002546 RepID=UPI002930F2E1|nr:PrpF domain-containing protein [uncultured Cohaesibacter sp.]